MTHVNVNNQMFVHAGPQHMMGAGGQPIASIAAGHPGQPPQQQMQPGPGAVQINAPYGVQPGQTRPGGPPGETILTLVTYEVYIFIFRRKPERFRRQG